jgi:transcriptional regulator with XRE-family HTH domain
VQLDARQSAKGEEGFGSLLRRYRALAGLSQEALAERAGISRRGIADLERGARRFPYPDTASRLAAALELGGAERVAFMAASRPRRTGSTRRYRLQTSHRHSSDDDASLPSSRSCSPARGS